MTKILLVEDDKSLREIYGVRLLAEGYDIVSAGDGEEALAMAIKEKPTLIISDVMMPKISGFDMLDILRSTTETRDIKVIMMTALSSDDQRTRGEQLGADRYLVKSQVGIEDVVRTVHEVLDDSVASPAAPVPSTPSSQPAAEPENTPEQTTPPPAEPAVAEPTSDEILSAPTDTVVPAPEPTVEAPEADTSSPGPLPPQPSEEVSTLPQPTAPFSSPRPTNLGERVIHPLDEQEAATAIAPPEVGDEIEKELQASIDQASAPATNDFPPLTPPLEAPTEQSQPSNQPPVPPVPGTPPPTITGTSIPIS